MAMRLQSKQDSRRMARILIEELQAHKAWKLEQDKMKAFSGVKSV